MIWWEYDDDMMKYDGDMMRYDNLVGTYHLSLIRLAAVAWTGPTPEPCFTHLPTWGTHSPYQYLRWGHWQDDMIILQDHVVMIPEAPIFHISLWSEVTDKMPQKAVLRMKWRQPSENGHKCDFKCILAATLKKHLPPSFCNLQRLEPTLERRCKKQCYFSTECMIGFHVFDDVMAILSNDNMMMVGLDVLDWMGHTSNLQSQQIHRGKRDNGHHN